MSIFLSQSGPRHFFRIFGYSRKLRNNEKKFGTGVWNQGDTNLIFFEELEMC